MTTTGVQPDTTLPKVPKIKKYTALLTQVGAAAPTVKILQNTLGGTIIWTRGSSGAYIGTLAGAFTPNKTAIFMQNNMEKEYTYVTKGTSGNTIAVLTSESGVDTDDLLSDTPIEIRVYTI